MRLFRPRPRVWPTGTYTDWRWPAAPRGYTRFDWELCPQTDPSPVGYFWSHQFWLVGGEAGYVGLQTQGSEPTGKIAIFSIWQATGANGPSYVAPFSGEGSGFSVRIPFEWRVGEVCRLAVGVAEDPGADGVSGVAGDPGAGGRGRWTAWVAHEGESTPQMIGTVTVPGRWGGLRDQSVMWTERYAGVLASCVDLGHAVARFSTPVADGGLVRPVAHHNHLGVPPGCPGSSVIDGPDGVVHVMGSPDGGGS
jgi:hypothetical protein